MSYPKVPLHCVADINPQFVSKGLSPDLPVSFVPMAAVSEVLGEIVSEEQRILSEVSKGFTPFRNDDVLLAKITPCFENGKIAHAQIKNSLGFGSTEFHVIRPHPQSLNARYIYHFLRQPTIRHEGERKMTGSAGQRRVPKHFLESLEIPLPSLSEQRRLAAFLDKADELCRCRREAIAKLETLLKSSFISMFGNPMNNTKGWPSKQLADVVAPGKIVTYGIVQAGPEIANGVPYIRTGDIKNGEIVVTGLLRTSTKIAEAYKRSEVREGDIVMSIRATVGTTAVVPQSLDGANLTQGTARISPGPLVEQEYLLWALRSHEIQEWIRRQVKGATFREITLARLRELPILIPPLDQQQQFARVAQRINRVLTAQKAGLLATESLFKSLQKTSFNP